MSSTTLYNAPGGASKANLEPWPTLKLYALEDSEKWWLTADGHGIEVGPTVLFNPAKLHYKFFFTKYIEPYRPNIGGRDFPHGLTREEWRPHLHRLLREHGTLRAWNVTVNV